MQNLKAQRMKLEKMGGAAYNTGMGRGETGEGVDNVAYDPYKTDSYMGHTPNPNPYNPLWQQSRYRTTPYEKEYGFSELWND